MMYMSEAAFTKLLPGIKNYDYTWGITVSPKEQSNIEEKLENIIIQNQDIKIESLHGRVENYRSANTIYTILQVASVLIFCLE